MSDMPSLAMALLVGALLGAIFFGGLWWTVQKGLASKTPALWFLGSLVVRIGLILAGFYVVGQGEWSRFLACLVGFLIARVMVVRWCQRKGQTWEGDAPAEPLIRGTPPAIASAGASPSPHKPSMEMETRHAP